MLGNKIGFDVIVRGVINPWKPSWRSRTVCCFSFHLCFKKLSG